LAPPQNRGVGARMQCCSAIQPATDLFLNHEQTARQQNQERHNIPEPLLRRRDQQYRAEKSADDGGRGECDESPAILPQFLPVRPAAGQRRRPERERVGRVGGDG